MNSEIIQPAKLRKWYEIWWDVWSHPSIVPFQSLLQEEKTGLKRSILWVGIAAFISYLIPSLLIMILPGVMETLNQPNYSIPTLLLYFMGIPIIAMIVLVIGAWIYHLIAEVFNGSGSWDRITFCFATIQAPTYLLSGALISVLIPLFSHLSARSGLNSISPLLCVLWLVVLGFSIYIFILHVNAIRAVENLSIGKAILTFFYR
jgi:hypothetical protein